MGEFSKRGVWPSSATAMDLYLLVFGYFTCSAVPGMLRPGTGALQL
jgi:hypothetical protein